MVVDVKAHVFECLEGFSAFLEEIHAGRLVRRLGVPHLAVVFGQHALAEADCVRDLRRSTSTGLKACVRGGHGESLPAGVDVHGGGHVGAGEALAQVGQVETCSCTCQKPGCVRSRGGSLLAVVAVVP